MTGNWTETLAEGRLIRDRWLAAEAERVQRNEVPRDGADYAVAWDDWFDFVAKYSLELFAAAEETEHLKKAHRAETGRLQAELTHATEQIAELQEELTTAPEEWGDAAIEKALRLKISGLERLLVAYRTSSSRTAGPAIDKIARADKRLEKLEKNRAALEGGR